MDEPRQPASALHKRATRRALIGGVLTAGSVAVAYAVFGDDLRNAATGTASSDRDEADAAALSKESVRINHLLRRAGFGVSPAEYERYQSIGLEATIAELVNYTSVDDQHAVDLAAAVRSAGPEDRETPGLWWLTLIANTKRPLQEKMTLFWHGLLTSQISIVRDPAAMLVQNDFFRAHAMADLPSILRGITYDAAMMVYLDTAGSQRRAPNENYARELMELFALGEGNYTESDVREAARAFTGWVVPRGPSDGNGPVLKQPDFRPQQFDSGMKSFLGRQGEFRADDIVQIIAEQPAASQHIVRQLYSYFIHDAPSDADIEPFVRVFDGNQQRVGPVVEAMLRSDVFYSPRSYRSLVKGPIEYAVGAIKALDLQEQLLALTNAGQGVRGGGGVLGAMGQIPFEPPNVAGWPRGRQWLNSTTLYARLNFINTLTGGAPPDRGGANAELRPNQARRQAQQQQAMVLPGLETASAVTSRYLPLLLDDNLSDEARALLLDYAGTPDAPLTPDLQRGLAYLMLASPQYHLS